MKPQHAERCVYCRDGLFEDGGCQGECEQSECPHGGPTIATCEFCGGTGLAAKTEGEVPR